MSADNGIYILKTLLPPIKKDGYYINQSGYEYRVSYCHDSDLDDSELNLAINFGNSKVYYDVDEAVYKAEILESEYDFLEYGISLIEKRIYFPNITVEAAKVAKNCYVGAIPLDVK